MSTDISIEPSANSETVPSDDGATITNYSRWMTDTPQIANLKLHQLAIPGSHNAGVDDDGKTVIGKSFAVCQTNSFTQQLEAGSRYLDCRISDQSYKKDIGGSKIPRYKFVQVFDFRHGPVSVGRTVEDLVLAVFAFTIKNPQEIIIIDVHDFDRGKNYAHNSLQRLLPLFHWLKNQLIPPSASNMSIGEIRQKHPGCNVILTLAHNYPRPESAADTWPSGTVTREQIWNPFPHHWSSDDSETNIAALVSKKMKSPPRYDWVLSAAVRYQNVPRDLPPSSSVRSEVFKPGYKNANILMVDFVESKNSRTSVVDPCIALTRSRAADNTAPTAPTNLKVEAIDEDYANGKFQNTLKFSWTPATHSLGVQYYQIFRDGVHLATTSENPYEHKNFLLINNTYTVKAFSIRDQASVLSNPFDLQLDKVPPTIPKGFRFTRLEPNRAYLEWEKSIDAAGLKGYEVCVDGTFREFIPAAEGYEPSFGMESIAGSRTYEITVRAVDNNALKSEYAKVTVPTRPTLTNPTIKITEFDEQTQRYIGNINWEQSVETTLRIKYSYTIKNRTSHVFFSPGETPIFPFTATENEVITFESVMFYTNATPGPHTKWEFTLNPTAPDPVQNLRVTSTTATDISVAWTPSLGANLKNQAISLDEAPPILLSRSAGSYKLEGVDTKIAHTIEVWGISEIEAASNVASLTTPGLQPPASPTNFTKQKQGDKWVFTWTAPSGQVDKYYVTLLEVGTGRRTWEFTDTPTSRNVLDDQYRYLIEISAIRGEQKSSPLTVDIPAVAPPQYA